MAGAAPDGLSHVAASGALIEEINWVDPEAAFLAQAGQTGSLWLDSSDTHYAGARHSFIACAPYKMLRFHAHQAGTGFAALEAHLGAHQSLWADLPQEIDAQVPPFRGGAAGLFGYGLGAGLEPSVAPSANPAEKEAMVVGLYASVLAFDHAAKRCFIIATGLPHDTVTARADAARQDISRWQQLLTGVPGAVLPPPPDAPQLNLAPSSNFSRAEYCDSVGALVAHILDGDIFQTNLAQCFSAELGADDDALSYYRRWRRAGPAPFSAFFQMGDYALASASPERFLQMADGRVETRPIKGTQKRGATAAEDAANARRPSANAREITRRLRAQTAAGRSVVSSRCACASAAADMVESARAAAGRVAHRRARRRSMAEIERGQPYCSRSRFWGVCSGVTMPFSNGRDREAAGGTTDL